MIPDIEKVVANYLRARSAFTSRVVVRTPDSVAASWVRLTVLNAPQDSRSRADRNVAFYLQFDCYAGATGGQPEASTLARIVRNLISVIDTYPHADAEVTAGRINGMARVPDNSLEPARERYILTATVYAH